MKSGIFLSKPMAWLRRMLGAIAVTWFIALPGWAEVPGQDLVVDNPDVPDNLQVQQRWQTSEQGRVYLWQGFDHQWRRFVGLPEQGRVPHRISKIKNYLQIDSGAGQVFAVMGQSTGVDGNYMRPKTYLSRIEQAGLQAYHGVTQLSWTDQLTPSEHPQAINSIAVLIKPPAELDPGQGYTLVLAGFELDLSCDDADQPPSEPCNSDGIWPYRFNLDLQNCSITPNKEEDLACQLQVEIHRAWTPNLGGFQLPPIFSEIKPINHRLQYRMRVHYTLLTSQDGRVWASQPVETPQAFRLQDKVEPLELAVDGVDLPSQKPVMGIKGFGFELSAADVIHPLWQWLGSDTGHRGRYLAALSFNVSGSHFNESSDRWNYVQQQKVWAPISVVDSHVETRMTTQALWLPDDADVNTVTAKGKICINSTDQAPAFSRWKKCDLTQPWANWLYGTAQDQVRVFVGETDAR